MSPKLTRLLKEAPSREVFPTTELIELGLAEEWSGTILSKHDQYKYPQGVKYLSANEAITDALKFGLNSIQEEEGMYEVEVGTVYTYTMDPGDWLPVFKAAMAWDRKRRGLEPQPIPVPLATLA